MTIPKLHHWPEYLMESAGLGIFMISACMFGTLLFHTGSPVVRAIPNDLVRRLFMGLAMGATNCAIIYSPWGKQSGAHLNPAVTLTFYRLGKVARKDAGYYMISQFLGGLIGVLLAYLALGRNLANPSVNFVVTAGMFGNLVALLSEIGITFILMSMILRVTNVQYIAKYTGLFASALVALYITFENPLSGMSMNPARSFASALPAGYWHSIWIYFVAPPIGMLLAAEVFRFQKSHLPGCAKLHHHNDKRCIFCAHHSPTALVEDSIPSRELNQAAEHFRV